MTAKKIMEFAEKHAYAENMFNDLDASLCDEKTDVCIALESNPDNKKLKRRYDDICEKQRMIRIMRVQRLELFRQSKI